MAFASQASARMTESVYCDAWGVGQVKARMCDTDEQKLALAARYEAMGDHEGARLMRQSTLSAAPESGGV